MRVLEEARYKWYSILKNLGVPDEFLVNRHGPCPFCGGKDRYRWDDKDGKGTWYCNSCGAGNGFRLLMLYHNWDETETRRRIMGIIGVCQVKKRPMGKEKNARRNLRQVMSNSKVSPAHIGKYLRSRGLSTVPDTLLYNKAAVYQPGEKYPAMIGVVRDNDGEPITIHRTFLADVNPRKKVMTPIRPMSDGAAIRIFDHTEELGIAEGIETAIAAHEMFNIPTWSVISAEIMEKFQPPEGVKRLVIFADNDESFHGQKSAYNLAFSLNRSHDIDIEVMVPKRVGDDWLDVLNNRRS